MSQDSTAPEVFRPIPDFPGYEISDHGTPRSYWIRCGGKKPLGTIPRNMKPSLSGRGYLKIGLWKNGKVHQRNIHRLMLEIFVGPCPPGHEAAHENGIPNDNRIGNLKWKTKSSNNQDKRRHGTHREGEKIPTSKLTASQVRQICKLAREVSRVSLARKFGVAVGTISRIVNGHRWKHLSQ